MHQWFKPKDKLPENEQECLLMPPDRGIITTPVIGPIMWSENHQCWLDFFASPEAGSMIKPEQVWLWCDWESLAPREEEN